MAYAFDHGWEQERQRLAALEAACDPWTIHNLEALGVETGWRCLEVGGGGGSIAAWLCRRVGPSGRVVATDVETRFLEAVETDNLEVRRHDVTADALEEDAYDLVHARAVLDHIPERDAVVPRLVAALRPGGWLTLEGGDFTTVRALTGPEDDALFFDSAFATVVEASRVAQGFDPVYGRRLGVVMRAAGLVDVTLQGVCSEWDAEHPLGELYRLTFARLREPVVEAGVLTAGQFDRLLALMRSPELRALGNTVFFASGRRPEA